MFKIKEYLRTYAPMGILILIIISPSLMYYLANGKVTFFLPFFVLTQIAMLTLLAGLLRRKLFTLLAFIPFAAIALPQWAHFSLFRYELTEGAMAAMFATNSSESTEFLVLLPFFFWVIALLIVCGIIFSTIKYPNYFSLSKKVAIICTSIIVISFTLKLVVTKDLKLSIEDVFYKSHPLKTVFTTAHGLSLIFDFKKKISALDTKVIIPEITGQDTEQIHVLIIGETSRKKNWSLYGYGRPTNEFTPKISPNIYVFKNVVSVSNTTIPSIMGLLSHVDEKKTATILDVASAGNYKTYWLSNQAHYGAFDNPTSVLATRADNQKFINTDTSNRSYDDQILPSLKEILAEREARKFIVIHLMGSHFAYERRYPKEFKYFENHEEVLKMGMYVKPNTKLVNDYDNSIRYTDYVIGEVIKLISETQKMATVLYVSDHGEILYDEEGVVGHGSPVVRKSEVEIPMLMWISPAFAQHKTELVQQVDQSLNKEIMMYDFFPSYLHLLGLKIEIEGKENFFVTDSRTGNRFVFNPNAQRVYYQDLK